MKGGNLAVPSSLIRQYLAQRQAKIHTEAIVTAASDLRQTYAQLNAGTKSNVTAYVEDAVRLTPSGATGISHTTGTDDLTDLSDAKPDILLAWILDESQYGADLRISNIQLYIDHQRDTANPPFDGFFLLNVMRIGGARGYSSANDLWTLQSVATMRLNASDITAAGLQSFTPSASAFGENVPYIPINEQFIPPTSGALDIPVVGSRVVVLLLRAYGGSNTNYSWKYNSATSNPETVVNKGTLYHLAAATPTGPAASYAGNNFNYQVSAATGIPRVTFTVNSYAASGSLTFTDIDLGAAPSGTVEFRVTAEVPAGCTGLAEASDDAGVSWSTITDGCTPDEASPALTAQQTYRMRYTFTANSSQSASPALRLLGVLDRTLWDVTEIAGWTDSLESVNPLTGEVKIADAECRLQFNGNRDYLDMATRLLSENDWDDIEIRTHVYHPDLARSEWGLLDLWKLDNAVLDQSEAVLSCISVLAQLRGKYPQPSGTLYGYLLKTTDSDLTVSGAGSHTPDFTNKEISLGTQATSSVTWNVAAGATEYAYFITPAGVPGLRRWAEGDWSLKFNLTTGDSNIKLAFRLMRVNSAGAIQTSGPSAGYSNGEEFTASTGQHTRTQRVIAWLKTIETTSDRLVIELRARNTDGGGAHSIIFETGTVNTEIRPPWIRTTEVVPQQFSNVTLASAASTWRDTVVALPARFRGALTDHDRWKVSKAVMDADGQREFERISFLAGVMPIASQGVIKHANLWSLYGLPVHSFAREVANVQSVTMGFNARLPEYQVGYGFETNIPNDFSGKVKAQHAAAFAAFGRAKIDEPAAELEHEAAKYIAEPGLAGEIARAMVLNFGCGVPVIECAPTDWCPWLELGDDVGIDTDQVAFKDPVTTIAMRGPLWAKGRIIGKSGHLNPRFAIVFPGPSALHVTSDSVAQRSPYEGPAALPSIERDPASLANAILRIRAFPPTAAIYYYYHATTEDPPARDRVELWSTYSAAVTLLRDQSSEKLVSCFATYNGFTGPVRTARVAPDTTPTIGTLSGSESGTAPTIVVRAVASSVDADTRRIRWYARKHATDYPTIDGTSAGQPSETYFIAETEVNQDGGLEASHSGGYSGADKSQWIAVPIDYLGNWGTRKSLSYTVAGSATPTVDTISWALNTAGTYNTVNRSYDFTWTDTGMSDATDEMHIYVSVNGAARIELVNEGSPNSVQTATAVEVDGLFPRTGYPFVTVRFEYELLRSSVIVDSGTIPPNADFQGVYEP